MSRSSTSGRSVVQLVHLFTPVSFSTVFYARRAAGASPMLGLRAMKQLRRLIVADVSTGERHRFDARSGEVKRRLSTGSGLLERS